MTALKRPNVVCLRPRADFERVGVGIPETLDVRFTAPDASDLGQIIAAASALVIPAVGPALPSTLFEASAVKLVQVTGAGVDRLDRDAMLRLAIPVANVPGGSNDAVAEYVVSTALFLLRQFARADRLIRDGRYAACRQEMLAALPAGLGGLTVGIVGLGEIGLAVASAFHRFGARIVYSDENPEPRAGAEALQARRLPLADLLAVSDVVSLHVPLIASTRNLVDADALATMKPSAVLINAARGGVVDEIALADALVSGRLSGAGVDVYSSEPPETGNPLLAEDVAATGRLILTPHIAGISRQAWARLFELAWRNVEATVCEGAKPSFRVY